jgi:16S rRNA processing protein RimM
VSAPANGDEVVVARIGKPHGLRGEVTDQLHTDDPETRFAVGSTLATQADAGTGVPRTLTIRSTRVHQGVWLLGFEQIPDRTGAESLRGTRLVIDAEDLEPGGDDDAWYEDELRGLAVHTPDGARIGEVTRLEMGPAQDLLVVALDTGGDAYLPFVEAIVPEVDVEGGRVVVDPPEGLLELNA